ncbi:MAG: oxidoreductase [Proteobacteria bacterium]|nr:oxidoreductase [Pseudomonadota bacterium]
MSKFGLLINYEYCTGCHSCEVACQQEHSFSVGKSGIRVTEHVYPAEKKPVAVDYIPFPTELCDLCMKRYKNGELPACVKHCQSFCMSFGQVHELVKKMDSKTRLALFVP